MLDDQTLAQLKNSVDQNSFTNYKTQAIRSLEPLRESISRKMTDLKRTIEQKRQSIQPLGEIIGKRREGKTQVDMTLITWALPVFGLCMIGLLLIPLLYKDTFSQRSILGSGLLLDLITVFLLTGTILILGLGEKIQSEALGTLLGGISGYVLGRSLGKRDREREKGSTTDAQS